jgi:hypothetical protein
MVANRLIDVDTQRYQYGLVDGTNTNHWQYHEEDVESLFRLTGLAVTDSTKFVTNDDAKELLARRCDHHWTDVHDRDSHDVTGQQCLKCREIKPREALK